MDGGGFGEGFFVLVGVFERGGGGRGAVGVSGAEGGGGHFIGWEWGLKVLKMELEGESSIRLFVVLRGMYGELYRVLMESELKLCFARHMLSSHGSISITAGKIECG